jgi:predicted permease
MKHRARLRAYRTLLRIFPRDFRGANGQELSALFLDMCAEWDEAGKKLGIRFWASLVWDTSIQAGGEWVSLIRAGIGSVMAQSSGEHMFALIGDVRYAVRQILRQPTYSAMVVVLMALGIAGNAAVFRVFNGLFLRPLPFENSEQLVDIDETAPKWDLEYLNIAYRDYAAWSRNNNTFHSMMVFESGGGNFIDEGGAQRVDYLATTHTADEVLGLQPSLGRFFTPEEDHPEGPRVMMLSQAFWQQEYGADPTVLGRTVSMNGRSVEIVGVLPGEARFMDEADIWIPLREIESEFDGWGLNGIGRLNPGTSVEQALANLTAVHEAYMEELDFVGISSPVIAPLRDRYLGEYRLGGGFLLAAVGIVLLIACANIAGLMSARAMSRAPEMAVRIAMGAPRRRIVRQLLTESVVLASIGAAAGIVLGTWGSNALVAPLADQFPSFVRFDLDIRFLGFTLAVTMGAALLFGLAPALKASASSGASAITNRSTTSARDRSIMSWLVTGEVAMALVLLVVGGLSVLDAHRLGQVDPGFESEGVTAYAVELPSIRYEGGESRAAFVLSYLERLEAIPGVESAAAASALPLSGHWGWFYAADGAPPRNEEEGNPVVLNRAVSPSYFETMGVELVAGRVFDEFDGREGSEAVIVNETFVRTHLSHVANPVGTRVAPGTSVDDESTWFTVVGVTKDVKHYGVDEEMRPGVYVPFQQVPLAGFLIALKTRGDRAAVLSSARAVTADMDVELPLFGIETMAERMDASLLTRRATSWLIGAFSTVALLLAVAGIYGVISYSVGHRKQEIGIRMAMGARQQQVLHQVLRQGMALVGLGVGMGLVVSFAGAGLVSGILVGVDATEPLVYLGVTAVLVGVAALANYLPARRAAAMNPMRALRGE